MAGRSSPRMARCRPSSSTRCWLAATGARSSPCPDPAKKRLSAVVDSAGPRSSSWQEETRAMRKLIVSEFITLDGVIQAPGGVDEDRDGGFAHGAWTTPYWHDDIGKTIVSVLQTADAFLLGRRTYVGHADAFEPLPAGDFFGDVMNAPAKYVVSKTLQNPRWRNTTVIRGDVVQAVRDLK